MLGKAVSYQPAGVETSKGKPNIGGLVLGKAVGYQPAGVDTSKGKPNIDGLVLGKAVGYQPAGVEMSKGKPNGSTSSWRATVGQAQDLKLRAAQQARRRAQPRGVSDSDGPFATLQKHPVFK